MLTRDLDDPATGRFMADQVETVERLKALTLMTYCDLSAVNPTAMTPWRREQLWRLYLLTFQELTRELDADRIEAAPGLPAPVASFLLGFPTRYRRTHSQAEMERHYALDQTALGRGVASELNRLNHVYEITVVTRDRPFLFASIAGALSSFGLNILKAEAFSNRRGTILDTFTFADPLRTLELNPSEQERLQALVERVALGKADVAKLLKSRPLPHLPGKRLPFRPAVAFDNEASATATLVHVVAPDRPGLLYDLAHSFSAEECNIEVVLVDTESFKAMDVFYVTRNGGKLDQECQQRLSNSLLAACHL
jgi:[protein-PII] uridylyltransferase